MRIDRQIPGPTVRKGVYPSFASSQASSVSDSTAHPERHDQRKPSLPAEERVILVDKNDRELGSAEKINAHEQGGQLHRAFSVFIRDPQGRIMLQRRAPSKYHFAGLWTNTCCGHPRPGETTPQAATRRLQEEMGIRVELKPLTSFIYKAHHEPTGLTEHEIDHVLVGEFEAEPTLNPDEADDWRWIEPDQLDRELAESPDRFTPWFPIAWAKLKQLGGAVA